jgi:hypothetical protein
MYVTLALCMLVTALYLAPQPARAAEAAPFDVAKALRDAKTPAEHEVIAAYYDQAATTAHAQAAESLKIAEAYRNIAGKGQFRIESRYRQQAQSSESLAADYTARAVAQRQLAQTLAQKPQ